MKESEKKRKRDVCTLIFFETGMLAQYVPSESNRIAPLSMITELKTRFNASVVQKLND